MTAPVRPTFTSIFGSSVVFCSAGNLNAIAQRGNLLVAPSARRCAYESTLMTTPSVSNGERRRRSSPFRAERDERVHADAVLPVGFDRQSPLAQRFSDLGAEAEGPALPTST